MTSLVPDYVPGLELDAAGREDALRLVDRVRALHRAGTTDRAEGTWVEPVANYLDPALFEAEKALVFAQVPLPLALSGELVGPEQLEGRSTSPARPSSSPATPRARSTRCSTSAGTAAPRCAPPGSDGAAR